MRESIDNTRDEESLDKKLTDEECWGSESERSSVNSIDEKQQLPPGEEPRLVKLLTRMSASVPNDPGPPPDGGLLAWTQVAMGWLFIINSFGYMSSFGVFQTYYTTFLGHSPSSISWIGAVQMFLPFFIGTFSGRALDAGLFKPVFALGAFLSVFGTFMTSISTRYYQIFLAQGVCSGIGFGLAYCPCTALVSTYFSKRRNLALSIIASGSGAGGILFPALVSHLTPSIGFPWTVRVVGFIQLALNLLVLAFMKTRIPPRKAGPIFEPSAFKELTYSFFCAGMFFNFWALYFAFFYIGAFAKDKIGLSLEASNYLVITLNGVGIIGRLVPAVIADKWTGPLNIIGPFTLVSAAIMFGWIGVGSVTVLYVFAVLYGFFANGMQGLFPATASSLTTDLSKAGVRMGMVFTIVSFASLTGPPLGGALVTDSDGSYVYAQIWGGISLLLGSGFLFAARIASTGWTWKVKV